MTVRMATRKTLASAPPASSGVTSVVVQPQYPISPMATTMIVAPMWGPCQIELSGEGNL